MPYHFIPDELTTLCNSSVTNLLIKIEHCGYYSHENDIRNPGLCRFCQLGMLSCGLDSQEMTRNAKWALLTLTQPIWVATTYSLVRLTEGWNTSYLEFMKEYECFLVPDYHTLAWAWGCKILNSKRISACFQFASRSFPLPSITARNGTHHSLHVSTVVAACQYR